MEGLKDGFLVRACVLQSKVTLLACFPPFLLLLYIALPPLESSLMPIIWHAVHADLKGPALPFLLLNCVTLTIFASCKLGGEKSRHEDENPGHLLRIVEKGENKGNDVAECILHEQPSFKIDALQEDQGKGGDASENAVVPSEGGREIDDVAECVLERPSLKIDTPREEYGKGADAAESAIVSPISDHLHTPREDGGHEKRDNGPECVVRPNRPDLQKKNEDNFLRKSWSLNASFDVNKQAKAGHGKERKPNVVRSRARPASRSDDKVRLNPSKPLSNERTRKQLITSSHAGDSESTQHERPTQKTNNSPRPQQAQKLAPAVGEGHPSMEEVWAAITSSKKRCNHEQEEQNSKPDSKTVAQLQPRNAVNRSKATRAAAAVLASSAAAATNTLRAPALLNANKAGKATAAAEEQRFKGWHAEPKNGDELEKLNRRAEEFIGRFNYQMRLQREESLRRRERGCRPRRSYDVLPVGGPLVG